MENSHYPSEPASNAIIYLSYSFCLILGLYVAWRAASKSTSEFISGNGTQKAIPLALNFVASSMGCGILTTYPQISTIAGVQGLIVYGISSAAPLMIFAFFGPAIRKACPDGFVLTEWIRQRYGLIPALYVGFLTVANMFLYMVAELSAIQSAIQTLTGMDALPALIVECVFTSVYTCLGGFHTSFFTDNIQGAMAVILLIICSVAMGTQIDIQPDLIAESGYLKASTLGWQLIYILPVCIVTNDCFLSSFWIRTFASRSNKDLMIGCSIATVIVFIFLMLVGSTGLLANWSGLWPAGSDGTDGYMTFFIILLQMPRWVVGFVLVFIVTLSTCTFDSLQSATVSSISNDVFRNRLPLFYIRCLVLLLMAPCIVVALKAPNILQIYLIADLFSAAVVPVLFLGLSKRFWFVTGWEVVIGSLGGLFSVFVFGWIYYQDAHRGAKLLILENGLYTDDWSAFGAFVVAPGFSIVFSLLTISIRLGFNALRHKQPVKGVADCFESCIIGPITRSSTSSYNNLKGPTMEILLAIDDVFRVPIENFLTKYIPVRKEDDKISIEDEDEDRELGKDSGISIANTKVFPPPYK
ncbi:hypothetical protein NADFUDRAFT_81809 [Nadsonia fulvescens var. elongata DSM 6958]|uniref:Urea transport protein n=1 Tax=Nadsonia fulvescens var. elongata DSM 6958 TaxID=857566 RepID=A0A1E3PPP7_9ASCO|nr:hypothetical protein NADFUDRAFT_81809 [Nadsonia fulvescens var. elongata DSM 6958]